MTEAQATPAKRGRKPKSSFYHTRWNRVRVNEQRAAEILGVTIEDVQRWDIEGAPLMAERLLLLWDNKNINVEGWSGFMFSRGALIHKNKRWRPDALLREYNAIDEAYQLQKQIRNLYSWCGLLEILRWNVGQLVKIRIIVTSR